MFVNEYVQEIILLEIGPLAAWTPSEWMTIVPEVSRIYPQVVGEDSITVNTTTAERTFWEKVTIAHWIASSGRPVPLRYARHYYDIIMLARAGVAAKAFSDLSLLEAVVDFKQRFYWSKAARYDLARPGTLRIVPGNRQLTALKRDYYNMETMFYQSPPTWSELVDELGDLESAINGIRRE